MIDPIEAGIVGPIILGLDGFQDAIEKAELVGLKPEHFTLRACREVWVTARKWIAEDCFTPEKLLSKMLSDPIFGDVPVDRSMWISEVSLKGSHHSMESNALALIERSLIQEAKEALAKPSSGSSNEILNEIDAKVAALRQKAVKTNLSEKDEACDELLAELASIQRGESLPQAGVQAWDMFLRGLPKSQEIVIAGRPGVAKTSLVEDIIDNQVRSGNPVLYIQRELSRSRAIGRIACRKAQVAWSKVESRTVSKEESDRLEKEVKVYKNLPLHLASIGKCNASTLGPLVKLHAKQHGIKLVVLDYLQLIDTPAKTEKRVALGEAAHTLKLAANTTGCTIILLSQLDRGLDRTMAKPTMADIRESGDIEQNADMILALWMSQERQEGDSKWPVNWSLIKNRNGGLGSAQFMFDGPRMSFGGMSLLKK